MTQISFLGIPIVIIITVIIVAGRSYYGKNPALARRKAYASEIADIRYVAPELIKYHESGNIPVFGGDEAKAVAVSSERLYVVSGDTLTVMNLQGKMLKQHKIEKDIVSLSISPDGDILLCGAVYTGLFNSNFEPLIEIRTFPEKTLLTGAAIEGDYIYAADAGHRVLLQFDRKGTLIREIGRRNSDKGVKGFIVPSPDFDVIPAGDNSVWAVNPGRHQLENYGSDGELKSSWNASALGIEGFCGCCNPARIALLPDGKFITAEKHIPRVKIYDTSGKFQCVVAPPSAFAKNAKILDIASDMDGRIYIIDSKTQGVRVFSK